MAKKQFETPSLTIEELTAELYLSKKDLKKAIGLLYKQRKIQINGERIIAIKYFDKLK